MKAVYRWLIAILFILNITAAAGQDIASDPEGDEIFSLPVVKIQPELALKNFSVKFPVHTMGRIEFYYDSTGGKRVTTMHKHRLLYGKGSIVSNDNPIFKLDEKPHLSLKGEFGYAFGFKSLDNPSDIRNYWTASFAGFAEYQYFDYYDTITDTYGEQTRRVSPGVKANATLFFATALAVSASASWQYAVNTDGLTAYQERTNTFYVDPNVATSGKKDGYFMKPEPVDIVRFSLSVPIFAPFEKNTFLPFVVIPYCVAKIADGESGVTGGIVVSFLKSKFYRFDIPKKKEEFKFETSFSVGFNFYSSDPADHPYLFLSGTFPIGKVLGMKADEKEAKKQTAR